MASSILFLGDSYTIGESVALHQNFPYQLIQMLRQNGNDFYAAEIVAKTGWTSFELLEHLSKTQLRKGYDFVTLLVGVNNQYRGLSADEFKKDFEMLLIKAIGWAKNNVKKVIVLSIPDWGVTPFAAERNSVQIANEINTYNGVCELLAQKYQTHFVEITQGTRLAENDTTLLTQDNLHYSEKEYKIWADKVFEIIKNNL